MTIYLKQSTASQEVPLGYFVDSTDGNTEETALTIANTDIKLWKTGATTLASKNSGGATHISNGIYYAVLDATDTDTLGSLVVFVHVAGALTVKLECVVLAANIYDSLIAGTDLFDVSVTQILGTAVSTPATAGVLDVNLKNIANAAVSTSSAQLGVNVVNLGGSAVDATSGLINANVKQISTDAVAADNAESFFDGTGYAGTGNVIPTVTAVTGLTASDVGAIKAKTDNLPASPANEATLTTIAGYIDTEVAAIKAKTDSLTFTVAGQVDTNVQSINDTALTGNGSTVPWGPA